MIRNVSLKNIGRIFLSPSYTVLYTPLVFVSYAVEYHFWGLRPFFFHLTNVMLHLINSLIVFLCVYLLYKDAVIAFITSLLFGIHPLHVESVAWITERKDLLYAFFFLLALLGYLYYAQKRNPRYLLLVILAYVLALLSKPVAVVLPFVLLLVDYFLEGRITRKGLLEKIPLVGIGLFFVILGTVTARSYLRTDPDLTLLDTLLIVNYVPLFYVYKTIVPLGLSCLYPYPLKTNNLLPFYFFLLPLVTLVFYGAIGLSLKYTRRIFFGFVFFLILISPALQLFPTGPTIVSDRYAYVASIGLFCIIAELATLLYHRVIRQRRIFIIIAWLVFIAVTAELSFLSWTRCKVWKNSFSLWNDAIHQHPDGYIPLAYFNRAVTYPVKRDQANALSDFDTALMQYYRKLGIRHNYAPMYETLLDTAYGYAAVYDFLGIKYAEINRPREAEILFKRAAAFDPAYGRAFAHLTALYGQQGEYKKAIETGEKAVALDNGAAVAHYNLSVAYYFDGQYDAAGKHFDTAVKLGFKPDPLFAAKIEKKRAEGK